MLLLVAGAIAASISFFRNTSHSLEAPISNVPAQKVVQKRPVPLDPLVRKVAHEFVHTAVSRQNLGKAYDLVNRDLKGTMTRAQWEKGNIPVVYYPPNLIGEVYHVSYSYADEALLEVGLVSKDPGTRRMTFYIGLVKDPATKRWLVNYWVPHYRPPVPLTPS